ncbi:cytochrome P450 [Aspergillus stella-maris]|uniref:cytochrome P450 n=1 Tax=Aspergillus stella-maris TaxID=1810926 RepID=UPI003CCCBD14
MDIILAAPNLYTAILISLTPLLLVIARARWNPPPSYPKDVPWPGDGEGVFSRLRSCFRGWPFLTSKLQEGYETFNRSGEPFVNPNFTLRPEVILPPKDLDWLLRLPDNVATPAEQMNDNLGLAHLFPTIRPIPGEKIIMSTINTHCNRHASRIQADIYEELKLSMDREFGTDSSCWQDVKVTEAITNIVRSVGGRVVFGLPVCRDERWLASAQRATNFFGASIMAFRLLPWLVPSIETWHEKIVREQRDGIQDATVPYNLATSVIRSLVKVNGEKPVDVPLIFVVNMHAASLIFDIASSNPKEDALQILREEATQHVRSEEDWNNLASFLGMPYTESAVRESLRLSQSQARALTQTVVSDNGLTLPSGQHVPKGTWLAVASMAMHLDDRYYLEARSFKPFRFVKEGDKSTNTAEVSTQTELKTEAEVERSSNAPFLVFGGGRHRW